MTRSDALATYRLRNAHGLAYTLVVREPTEAEQRSNPDRDVLTLDIYPRGARQPALSVPVGAPQCQSEDYERIRATVCAGLSYASEPSCWLSEAERTAAEDVGCAAAEAAWSHGVIGRWIAAGH